MGCCNSRHASDDNTSPYPASSTATANQNESTRAINNASATFSPAINSSATIAPTPTHHHHQGQNNTHDANPSGSTITTPRPSHSNTTRPIFSRSNLPLTEHVNAPLRLRRPWTSTSRTWTPSQLSRERAEFFETRVTGHAEIWAALSTAAELMRAGDLAMAQGILDAAGITVPTGDLVAGCYDEAGALYRLPQVVLRDPENIVPDAVEGEEAQAVVDGKLAMAEAAVDDADSGDNSSFDGAGAGDAEALARKREEKGKGSERDAMKVRARLSDRGGPDVIVLLGKEQSVGTLAWRVKSEARVDDSARIRIAYLGRILRESETLLSQGWKEGHVVNALVALPPPS